MRKIKKLLSLASVRATISTAILLIPILIGWMRWPWYVNSILLLLLGVMNAVWVYYERKKEHIRIEELLKLLVLSIWGREHSSHFRANVMMHDPKKDELKITYRYNMEGYIDRFLKIPSNVGCAGHAFTNKRPFYVDLTKVTHEKYLIDSRKVWKAMKSILSVPVFNPDNPDEVIGVLNVDSDLDIQTVKFNDESVIITVSAYADIIGKLLW